MNKKKISPLVTIILAAIIFSGLGLAAWYWTSQTLTKTITVEGWIQACSSFVPPDTVNISSYAELEVACTGKMNAVIRVATNGSNAETCFTTLAITSPPNCSVTATVSMYVLSEGANGGAVNLGPIATDGSESVQVIYDGNPRWFYESDYEADDIHVLFFLLDYTMAPNLAIGEYEFTATVTLGDDL